MQQISFSELAYTQKKKTTRSQIRESGPVKR